MGQLFWLSPKLRDFQGFRHAKTPKLQNFWKNRPIFEVKSLKMGMGFEARAVHPVQLKSEYPPPGPKARENPTVHNETPIPSVTY